MVLPLQGSATYLAFVPQFEAPSESLTHSIPRSFLVESLSAYAVGLADALWLCPVSALRLFFASVSFVDPIRIFAPLAQFLCCRYPSFAGGSSCGGASPHALGSVGALGVSCGSTYFKNTKNLFIHVAHYPVRRFLRDIPTFLKCPLHSLVGEGVGSDQYQGDSAHETQPTHHCLHSR